MQRNGAPFEVKSCNNLTEKTSLACHQELKVVPGEGQLSSFGPECDA